jgi:anti-sigma B factor antagonist
VTALTLTEGAIGEVAVLKAAGDVDVYTAPLLRQSLMRLDDRGHSRVLLDLTGCEFLDAPGLGVILAALKRARARGGWLRLACDREEVLKVLRVTGMDKVLLTYATRDLAVMAIGGGERR